jgi:hypothetical protein
MSQFEPLRKALEDLIDVLHLQAKDLEKLVTAVEQATGRLGYESQLSVVASELSELHHRVKHLTEGGRAPAPAAP